MKQMGGEDPGSFFRQVESVREAIEEITNNTKAIERLHSTIIAEGGNTGAVAKSQASLDAYQNSTTELISELRLRMKQLQKAAESGPTQEREVKRAQHSGLAKKLIDTARAYQDVQIRFKEQYKDRIRREYRVAKPKATEQEIEEAIQSNTNVFATQISTQKVSRHKMAYEDINLRHQEILKIEKSVTELYDLFLEMQEMLEVQQDNINVIEANVEEATTGLEVGNKEMHRAIKHRKSSRKLSWVICICVTIVFIIAIILIFNYIINPLILKNTRSNTTSIQPTNRPASTVLNPPIQQQPNTQGVNT